MQINLSSWQSRVWSNQARFKVLCVGRRGGKTMLALLKIIEEAMKGSDLDIWYIAPTYKQSKLIAWEVLKTLLSEMPWKAEFNQTELVCTLPNKTRISLKGADNPDSLRGTKIDFAVFDEVAFFSDWILTWNALRPLLTDRQAPAWFISTPNGFNHFYDLYNRHLTDRAWWSTTATSYDNPSIIRDEIDAAKRDMDERAFAQEYLAQFNRPAGVVYDNWDIDHFRPIGYDPTLPLHVTFDWGVNDPTVIIWIQPGSTEVRVIDYYEVRDGNIDHIVQVLNSKPYKTPELYTGDPAGKSRTLTTGTSPIEMLLQRGIYVKTTDGVTIPDQVRKAKSFMPQLWVDSDNAQAFRDVLINYKYPQKKESAINQSNEIPIHDQWSHGARAFEYWAVNYQIVSPNVFNKPQFLTYDQGRALRR